MTCSPAAWALSALALAREHPGLAARLIGATAAARDRTGLTPWPSVTEAERRTIERAEALLPAGEYIAQVTGGRESDDARRIHPGLADPRRPGTSGHLVTAMPVRTPAPA